MDINNKRYKANKRAIESNERLRDSLAYRKRNSDDSDDELHERVRDLESSADIRRNRSNRKKFEEFMRKINSIKD